MKRTVCIVILQGMVVVCAGADESFKIKSLENGKVPLGDTGLRSLLKESSFQTNESFAR